MTAPEHINTLSDVLIGMSWLAIIFAIYGFVDTNGATILNIASTQWLLISAILVTNAIFFRITNKKNH